MRSIQFIHIIGCGGIGSWLLSPLLRFLSFEAFGGDLQLWDGDRYDVGNLSRQDANDHLLGRPKAEAQADRYRQQFPGLRIWHRNEYVSPENVHEAILEHSLILVCVDNHPARTLISRQAAQLRDVCVLSAGNERLDGNVCIMVRRGGKALTSDILERHPEIVSITRGDRSQMGCEEMAVAGQTQLLVTNVLAATAMLVAFHSIWTQGQRQQRKALPQEVFFDAGQCAMTCVSVAG